MFGKKPSGRLDPLAHLGGFAPRAPEFHYTALQSILIGKKPQYTAPAELVWLVAKRCSAAHGTSSMAHRTLSSTQNTYCRRLPIVCNTSHQGI